MNALVAFDDGSYLELLAMRSAALAGLLGGLGRVRLLGLASRGRGPFERRFVRRIAAGTGLADFALRPEAIDRTVKAARERGLAMTDPEPGHRERPDGQVVRWRAAVPPTLDVPFLCADVTPRTLRVPEGDARRHSNGAVGVASVVVAVHDLAASQARYAALGVDAAPAHPATPARAATVEAVIALATTDDALARARLRSRGEGPCALTLRTASGAEILLDALRHPG